MTTNRPAETTSRVVLLDYEKDHRAIARRTLSHMTSLVERASNLIGPPRLVILGRVGRMLTHLLSY